MADLSWRDAIIKVLQEATEPLHCTEIAMRVAEQGLRKKSVPSRGSALEFMRAMK